jgi:DNA-binding response OmpR family regulator
VPGCKTTLNGSQWVLYPGDFSEPMSTIEYAHIALVEDDQALADLTQTFLESQGYRVTQFGDGPTAAAGIPTLNPDCVLLDIMLPGMDGIEVCRQLRAAYQGPILFMTAKGDPFDEVMGLEVGGDDYLSKPVEPRVLLAHIRAQLRRAMRTEPATEKPTREQFQVHASTESIYYQNEKLPLNQPEFNLLSLLLENTDGVVSRDDIMLAIRGIEHDGLSRAVDILVSDLRKKIPDPDWIKTVRGKGYVWQGPR